MIEAFFLLCIIAFIALSGFFSGSEIGIYSLNRLRLRMKLEKDAHRAHTVSKLLSDPQRLISTILIGNNLANYGATIAVTLLLQQLLHSRSELLSTLILTLPLFLFGEVVPKTIYRLEADHLVYRRSKILHILWVLFAPLALLLKGIGKLIPVRHSSKRQTLLERQHVEYYFTESIKSKDVSRFQRMMASNVVRIKNATVGHSMVTIDAMETLDADKTVSDITQMKTLNHSRYPVTTEPEKTVIGIVHILDLLCEPDKGRVLRDFARETIFVDEDSSLIDALRMLQTANTPLALVRKEGKVVGAITPKDILEEIVGELEEW